MPPSTVAPYCPPYFPPSTSVVPRSPVGALYCATPVLLLSRTKAAGAWYGTKSSETLRCVAMMSRRPPPPICVSMNPCVLPVTCMPPPSCRVLSMRSLGNVVYVRSTCISELPTATRASTPLRNVVSPHLPRLVGGRYGSGRIFTFWLPSMFAGTPTSSGPSGSGCSSSRVNRLLRSKISTYRLGSYVPYVLMDRSYCMWKSSSSSSTLVGRGVLSVQPPCRCANFTLRAGAVSVSS